MSFYSKKLYRDVGQNWRGVGFTYLLFLLALVWIPVIYLWGVMFSEFKTVVYPKIIEKVPEVQIKDGEVVLNKPMPYVISDEDTKKPFVVVDTTGKTTTLKEAGSKILITKNQVIMQKDQNQVETYTIPSNLNFAINQTILSKLLDDVAFWLLVLAYPVLVLLSFIYRIVQTLIYGAIGTLIFNKMIKAPLDYQAIVRLSVIAITPAVIISTISCLLFISFPFQWTLYFLLSILYLIYGIRANKTIVVVEQPIEVVDLKNPPPAD